MIAKLFDGGAEVTIISPHLDDAVFSAFGLLRQQRSVEIVTVFAAVPGIKTPPSDYDRLTCSSNPFLRAIERRVEDSAVARDMGWSVKHFNYLDHVYRAEPLDTSKLVEDLIGLFDSRRTILAPVGFGAHPDHHIVREASLAAAIDSGAGLTLYADLPYATEFGWPQSVSGVSQPYVDIDWHWDRTLSPIGEKGRLGKRRILALDDAATREKDHAMRRYRTQFPLVDNGPSRMLSSPERIGYEAFWPFTPDR